MKRGARKLEYPPSSPDQHSFTHYRQPLRRLEQLVLLFSVPIHIRSFISIAFSKTISIAIMMMILTAAGSPAVVQIPGALSPAVLEVVGHHILLAEGSLAYQVVYRRRILGP